MVSLDLQNVYVHQFIRVFNIHHTVLLSFSCNIAENWPWRLKQRAEGQVFSR